MPSAEHINTDSAEIAKFDALASRWWDPLGEFRPLHDMNPLRANYIDQRSPVAEKRLLDVGCGGGILTEAMAQRGAQVTGIDMAESPLAVARLHAVSSGVTVDYQQSTAEALADTSPGAFDIVTCLEMLEHVPDPASVIKACSQLVRPGGDVYFSTINRNPKAWALAVVGAEYVLRLLPKGTHEYAKFIKPSELASYARAAGLDIVHLTGITYNPLTRGFKLAEGDVSVNYLVHARKVAE